MTLRPVPAQSCPSVDSCTEESHYQRSGLQVRTVHTGDTERPKGDRAHSQVYIMLRRWRAVGNGGHRRLELGHIHSSFPFFFFFFFLISVGQSGNKSVLILRDSSQDSCVHMCTHAHTICAFSNTCLKLYKGKRVLTWSFSTW